VFWYGYLDLMEALALKRLSPKKVRINSLPSRLIVDKGKEKNPEDLDKERHPRGKGGKRPLLEGGQFNQMKLFGGGLVQKSTECGGCLSKGLESKSIAHIASSGVVWIKREGGRPEQK